MPDLPAAQLVRLPDRPGQSGIELSIHEQGSGPAVVLCHGFPELAYSWRYQLPAIAGAGFRAIAPDQRGYGGSSRPESIEDYGMTELTGDLVALLDALEIEKAIFVGHDWGGFVAWGMPVLYPERTAGVIGVCTPYMQMGGTDSMRAMFGGQDERLYILWFQQPGIAERFMDSRARKLFDVLMRAQPEGAERPVAADGLPDMNPFRQLDGIEPRGKLIVTQAELDTYVAAFEKTGFRGGINWYRNIDRNRADHPEIGAQKLDLPCLMLTAERDFALRPQMAAGMPALCSDLELHMIEHAGHWVQQEYPEQTNSRIVDWLTRRFAPGA
jgi:pimeloyl-ACP methyl ester carboxylesterase